MSSDPGALAALVEDLAADIEWGRCGRVRVGGPDDELPPPAVASLERFKVEIEGVNVGQLSTPTKGIIMTEENHEI